MGSMLAPLILLEASDILVTLRSSSFSLVVVMRKAYSI